MIFLGLLLLTICTHFKANGATKGVHAHTELDRLATDATVFDIFLLLN